MCQTSDERDFYNRSVQAVDRLVGCRAAAAVVADRDACLGPVDRSRAVAVTESEAFMHAFNDHYRFVAPASEAYLLSTSATNFRRWEHTEYVADFIRGNGMWSSAYMTGAPFMVSLFRGRHERPFAETEVEVLRVATQYLCRHHRLLRIVSTAVRARMTAAELSPGSQPLTRRELEIARCLQRRMTARETAIALGISPRTVECHIANMYEKLDVHCRESLIQTLFGGARGDRDLSSNVSTPA
ncbi:MAG: helix-turn-helix transcriptional regulator [Spirochaetota bacterium]